MAGKKMGSFGIVVLIIVTAVVLLLVAQAWQKLAPTATQVSAYDRSLGGEGSASRPRDGALANTPDLQQTRETTDAHAADVQEALSAID